MAATGYLPLGVSAAPAIFQRCIETVLVDPPRIYALDDIIVSSATPEDRAQRLGSILLRLQEAGWRVRKCRFSVAEVTYVEHRIDAKGVHATDKLNGVKELPEPNSKGTLQSFLEMLTLYDRYLEDRATVTYELRKLLVKNTPWTWEGHHVAAFENLKELALRKTPLEL